MYNTFPDFFKGIPAAISLDPKYSMYFVNELLFASGCFESPVSTDLTRTMIGKAQVGVIIVTENRVLNGIPKVTDKGLKELFAPNGK